MENKEIHFNVPIIHPDLVYMYSRLQVVLQVVLDLQVVLPLV
jgi:hypothetical protein